MSGEEAESRFWDEVVNRFMTARFIPHKLVMPDGIPEDGVQKSRPDAVRSDG